MIRNASIAVLISTLFLPFFGLTQESGSGKIKTAVNNWFEKSTIPPNKHILSLMPSNNQNPLILQTQSAFLQQNHTAKSYTFFGKVDALYINYQYTLKHNFFVEGGFKYLKYWTGYIGNRALMIGGDIGYSRSVYATYALDFGAGYGVVVNDNIKLFNVHAGFSLGITDNKLGIYGEYSFEAPYADGNGNIGVFQISSYYTIKNRVNLGYYIGLSKDIRLTDNLFLTARYHNYFRAKSVISEHYIHYSLSTYGIVEDVRANLTVKGQMVAVGLRWIF